MLKNKRSIYRDRKLRVKFKLYEKKKKVYKFIAKDLSKNLLIFLKQKHLHGLDFSLQDQLFITSSLLKADGNKKESEKKTLNSSQTNLKIRVICFASGYDCDKSQLNNLCSKVIFEQVSRLYKRIEKKKVFFSTRKLPTAVKINNRCLLTGTSRSVYRKFRIGRQALKKQINEGLIPSFTKTSF